MNLPVSIASRAALYLRVSTTRQAEVDLNPVWVIFAPFACGKLFGFIGLIIAVPFAAGVGVLVRFAVRQYFESPFYAGKPTESSNAIQD